MLPHDSGCAVDSELLKAMGVLYWNIPVDPEGEWEKKIDEVAREMGYKNRDIIESSKETMGKNFDNAMAMVWKEYVA